MTLVAGMLALAILAPVIVQLRSQSRLRQLEQAAREPDEKKRTRIYDQAQRLLTEDDVAIVPLFWTTEATLLSPKFTGLEYNSMARMDLRNVKPVAQ